MAIVKKTATSRSTGKKTTTTKELKPISALSFGRNATPIKATSTKKSGLSYTPRNTTSGVLSTTGARKEQIARRKKTY